MRPSLIRGKPTVSLYVCGVTPYDSGHMGHAFTFCTFDVLIRFLEAAGKPLEIEFSEDAWRGRVRTILKDASAKN